MAKTTCVRIARLAAESPVSPVFGFAQAREAGLDDAAIDRLVEQGGICAEAVPAEAAS